MGPSEYIFYVFAIVTVVSAILVIISKNPVHSVLWLILAFISVVGLFVLLGAEFLAMLLMIVYVGAVAVLFLFVVMMLDVDFAELKIGLSRYLPIGLLVAVLIILELFFMISEWQFADSIAENIASENIEGVENTVALGKLIYTDYIFLFQVSGLILFVAMIGSIVLTLRPRKDIKKQDIIDQIHRSPDDSVELKDIKPGQGL